VRRNPLLYSDHSEVEEPQQPSVPSSKKTSGKPSFFFYIIILANSLLVLFVLGFIWFLFLKSPDLQIAEISNRLFGTGAPTQQAPQPVVAPEIQTEVLISPTQQEKDEIQQLKLKQMREKEELIAERARLEKIKMELAIEKQQAEEAQRAINNLQTQENKKAIAAQKDGALTSSEVTVTGSQPTNAEEQPIEIEQMQVEALIQQAPKSIDPTTKAQPAAPDAANAPVTSTTSSQVDLIMEALKQQKATQNSQ